MKYPLLLAGIAATMSLIPIFGSILSSVPIVAIALISSGTFDLRQGLFVLGWIIGIHLLEANFLNPKIMGDAAKIHPVLVVFALIAGEHSYGLVGALFAVPGRLDHPDDLRLLPPPRRRGADAGPRVTATPAAHADVRAATPAGRDRRRRRAPIARGPRASPAARPRRGSPRRPRRARLVRDAAAVPAGVVLAWQTGQSEMPSTCR